MVQSIERAIRLLELLDRKGENGLALSELSKETGLKAPTARNILSTLDELGYVLQDSGTRRYRLGRLARRLGCRDHRIETLREVADPIIRELRHTLNETVLLAMYDDGYRHTLLSAESEHELRVGAATGIDEHFYETATGRLLVALLPSRERQCLFTRLGPPGVEVWPEAATSVDLEAYLAEVAERGWLDLTRASSHIRAVSAAIMPSGDTLRAAIGVYYPAARDLPGYSERVRAMLQVAAARVKADYERSL